MKTFTYIYENFIPLKNLKKLAETDDILFFDIETTGLSRSKNHIYLIGCGYYSNNGLNIIQWFAESEKDEINVLNEFISFSSSFSYLVNYNGISFDIPFTSERMAKYGLCMPSLDSIDIYTFVKPLKKLLSLSDMTQKSIELFLKIGRKDTFNGGELINVYHNYVNQKGDLESQLSSLLLHNLEDVLNMHYITEILDYEMLLNIIPTYLGFYINDFVDYYGDKKRELILNARLDSIALSRSVDSFFSDSTGSYIMNIKKDGTLSIRVPLIDLSLKHYFENYKDYVYLKNEQICVLKSVASYARKDNISKATKEQCFVVNDSTFIPIKGTKSINKTLKDHSIDEKIRVFKSNYDSKQEYISLNDFEDLSEHLLCTLVSTYYSAFICS